MFDVPLRAGSRLAAVSGPRRCRAGGGAVGIHGSRGATRALTLALAFAVMLVGAGRVFGQAAPETGRPSAAARPSAVPAGQSPATVTVADYSFGYELQVPGGRWTYDRVRFSGPVGSGAVGVLRGRSARERGTLQILFYRLPPDGDFDRWIDSLERQIAAEAGSKTAKISHELRKLGERRAAVIAADDKPVGELVQTYYYCVAFDASRVFVVVFGGIVADEHVRAQVKSEFERIAGSVRILYTPERQAEIAAGLERGQELLARLKSAAVDLPVDGETHFYEILKSGEPAGYFTRSTRREVRSLDDPHSGGNVKEGVRVRERSWLFTRDGTARYTRVDLFASSDMQSELLETRETDVPAAGAAARQVISTTDSCIREESKLISSFTSNLDHDLPFSREQTIGPNYLGLAWVRLLPALLGRDARDLHAFAIYDSTTRALVTYTVRCVGPRPLPGKSDRAVPVYEVAEAFAPRPALTYADENGLVLRVEAGDIVFQYTSEKAIETKFGALRQTALHAASMLDDGQ